VKLFGCERGMGRRGLTDFLKVKGILHPEVVANLYEFLSSAKHKGRHFKKK